MATLAEVQKEVHGVDKRVTVLEATTKDGFAALKEAIVDLKGEIKDLREDLSDQGRTPPPAPTAPTTEPPKPSSWMLKLAPGSGRELALTVISIASWLGTFGALLNRDVTPEKHDVHDQAPRDP